MGQLLGTIVDPSTAVSLGLLATVISSAIGIISYQKGVKDAAIKDGEYRAEVRNKVDNTLEMVKEYRDDNRVNQQLLEKLTDELNEIKLRLSNYESIEDTVNTLRDDYIARKHEDSLISNRR